MNSFTRAHHRTVGAGILLAGWIVGCSSETLQDVERGAKKPAEGQTAATTPPPKLETPADFDAFLKRSAGRPYADVLVEANQSVDFEEYEPGKSVFGVTFDKQLGDDWLRRLNEFPKLRYVWLLESEITDAGLQHLAALKNVESLRLLDAKVTDDGLKHLASLQKLDYLELNNTPIQGEGLIHLAKLPLLDELHLSPAQITEAGSASFGQLSQVRTLNLGGTPITNAGLRHIAAMPKLRKLSISDVTDEGVAALKGHPALVELDFSGEGVTDGVAETLKTIPNLKWISIYGTKISSRGISELRQTKPEMVVVGDTDDTVESLDKVLDTAPTLAEAIAITGGRVEFHEGDPQAIKFILLSHRQISDAWLARIATDAPHLNNLLLLRLPKITDVGLEPLKNLSQLEQLWVDLCNISDQGARHIGQITSLRELKLDQTNVTDAGIELLRGLDQLETLELGSGFDFDHDKFTAASLAHLAAFPKLKELKVESFAVDKEALRQFEMAHPQIKVSPSQLQPKSE